MKKLDELKTDNIVTADMIREKYKDELKLVEPYMTGNDLDDFINIVARIATINKEHRIKMDNNTQEFKRTMANEQLTVEKFWDKYREKLEQLVLSKGQEYVDKFVASAVRYNNAVAEDLKVCNAAMERMRKAISENNLPDNNMKKLDELKNGIVVTAEMLKEKYKEQLNIAEQYMSADELNKFIDLIAKCATLNNELKEKTDRNMKNFNKAMRDENK